MATVTTTDGKLVDGTDEKPLTDTAAAASAKRRNEAAAELGIKTRYVVAS
jgi:hypothetical protein